MSKIVWIGQISFPVDRLVSVKHTDKSMKVTLEGGDVHTLDVGEGNRTRNKYMKIITEALESAE